MQRISSSPLGRLCPPGSGSAAASCTNQRSAAHEMDRGEERGGGKRGWTEGGRGGREEDHEVRSVT